MFTPIDLIITRWRALRADLKKHVIAGAALALVFTLAIGALLAWAAPLLPAWWPWQAAPIFAALIGFAAAERIGWGKEYAWDASGRGNVDRDDYLYTGRAALLGAVLGMCVLFAVHALQT